MRLPLRLFACAVAAALGLEARPASVDVAAGAAGPVWEHRIVSGYVPVEREFGFDLERRLNALGTQGFRFATAVQPRPPLLAEEATVILVRDTTAPTAVVEFACSPPAPSSSSTRWRRRAPATALPPRPSR